MTCIKKNVILLHVPILRKNQICMTVQTHPLVLGLQRISIERKSSLVPEVFFLHKPKFAPMLTISVQPS